MSWPDAVVAIVIVIGLVLIAAIPISRVLTPEQHRCSECGKELDEPVRSASPPVVVSTLVRRGGDEVAKDERPPKPSTGCSLCDYVWVSGRGWMPQWNQNCTVHLKPSDL